MEFNVSHLLKSPVGTTREYDLGPAEDLPLDDDLSAVIDQGHVRLDRTNRGILARGHAEATVALTCARCLDPVGTTVHVDFAEEFEPSVEVTTGQPLPKSEDDMLFTIDQNHMLDLGEALRQNVIPALPLQPLCRADCAGICPICGANRNAAPCACAAGAEASDDGQIHPFAALADLLKEKSG